MRITGKLTIALLSALTGVSIASAQTFDEEGIKLPLRTWFGYHYQAAVPREIVQRMNGELRKIFDTPSFRSSVVEGIGLAANHGSIEDFDNYVRNQIKADTELVASIGIKPE